MNLTSYHAVAGTMLLSLINLRFGAMAKLAVIGAILTAFGVVAITPVNADPPPWAPAYGYRTKDKNKGKHKKKNRYERAQAYVPPFDLNIGRCNRDLLGALIGGAGGAALGSTIGKGDGKTAAIIGGAILGVLVGGSIGRTMDEIDQNCIGQALEHAPDGKTIVWQNPTSNTQYEIMPTRTVQVADGRYCREYTTTAIVAGKTQQIYGRACRQPDGSWEIQS
jgi:surface antigen